MLEHYRVLDLTDHRGHLASQILAGLGADVILVEPPGGSSARGMAPFASDDRGIEGSLTFWGYSRGKRSIAVDVTTPSGRALLGDLVRRSDVLFESGAVPIDLAELRRENPALVTVSISAFGTTGPKAAWPACDLTVLAASGQLVLTGDADRPPVRSTMPQAFLHAAGDAAGGALLALQERTRSGRGQHVDISAQRSASFATQSHLLAHAFGAPSVGRASGGQRVGDVHIRYVWPCKDGFVVVTLLFGPSFGPYTGRLMAWMHEGGYVDERTLGEDWVGYGSRLFVDAETAHGFERIKDAVGAFCLDRTQQELFAGAIDRRLLMAPIATTEDVAASPQFAARRYWEFVEDPALATLPVRAPGAFVHARSAPCRPLGRAPRLDEHHDEILAELHACHVEIAPSPPPAPTRRPPLDGLRVIDLTWALSGPATARSLSDFGATVVHIESSHRIDAARTVQPFLNDDGAPETAAVYLNMNAGKLGLSLNLGTTEARAVLDDLVGWADVLIESFSPRGRASLGLDYDRLRALNPRLIMMSSCLFGQDGPLQSYAGFGITGAALSGFYELTGWPDRAPAGPYGAYTDYVSPRFALCALLAAVEHRTRTGEGQYLDFAQAEAAVHFLTPALLDYTVNGNVLSRRGNDDGVMAPHGVYPCVGDDRWVAIACRDDSEWKNLCGLLGRSDLAAMTSDDRRNDRAALDAMVSEWTCTRSPSDAEMILIGHNIAAHSVQHSPECAVDPQLRFQRHFVELPHELMDNVTVESTRIMLSDTPSVLNLAAPILGQHTIEVLEQLLGYDEERIGALFAAGALD